MAVMTLFHAGEISSSECKRSVRPAPAVAYVTDPAGCPLAILSTVLIYNALVYLFRN